MLFPYAQFLQKVFHSSGELESSRQHVVTIGLLQAFGQDISLCVLSSAYAGTFFFYFNIRTCTYCNVCMYVCMYDTIICVIIIPMIIPKFWKDTFHVTLFISWRLKTIKYDFPLLFKIIIKLEPFSCHTIVRVMVSYFLYFYLHSKEFILRFYVNVSYCVWAWNINIV